MISYILWFYRFNMYYILIFLADQCVNNPCNMLVLVLLSVCRLWQRSTCKKVPDLLSRKKLDFFYIGWNWNVYSNLQASLVCTHYAF
uniref:Uncharacterized protein n=1 Tax=Oryza brachyantha TaxID=4533 RepID=J3LQX7_ORYBR